MNKRELTQQIAEQTGITHTLTREIVQKVFVSITAVLADSGRLELRDFGVFEVRHRPAYTARNPLTGEAVKVPAKDVVTFKAGKAMAENVQEKDTVA